MSGTEWYRSCYLASPEWRERRRRHLSRSRNRTCHGCGKMGVPIDVHHKTYDHIGAERGYELVSLCRRCHEQVHVSQRSGVPLREATKRILALGKAARRT